MAEAKAKAVACQREAAKLAASKIKPQRQPRSQRLLSRRMTKKEGSILSSPVFWIILILILGLAAYGVKAFGKKSGGESEDQAV